MLPKEILKINFVILNLVAILTKICNVYENSMLEA